MVHRCENPYARVHAIAMTRMEMHFQYQLPVESQQLNIDCWTRDPGDYQR